MTVDVAEVLAELPIFVPDRPPGPAVTALRARLAAADAVVICTPEYAYGMPGALKNALDWLVGSGELYRRPVAALSASPSERGGDRALASLRQTLQALGAVVPEAATFAVPFARQVTRGATLPDALADQARAAFDALLAARPAG